MNSMTSSRRLAQAAVLAAAVAVAPGMIAGHAAAADPAPAGAIVANGVLTITADDAANSVALALDPANPAILQLSVDQDPVTNFDRAQFTQIVIDARGGDDRVGIGNGFADEQVTVFGGAGNDTLLGGDGNDVLAGGAGDDFVDGNRGIDTALLGEGDDTFQWDPGDGSDVVEGQAGSDRMLFNGANIAEQMVASANGQRVRFTRDVGTVTMDLDGVERIDVRALGGADTVTVDDLTGTDLTAADIDLSATAGGGDGSADQVIVRGTDTRDKVSVRAAEGVVTVAGLTPAVTISGSEPALDELQVNTLGGKDKIKVADDVSSLIQLVVDEGGR